MQDRLQGILPLHLDGGACADHADYVGIDLGHRAEHVYLYLRDVHMRAVKSLGLAHFIETEEVEDNVRSFRCLDSFAQERLICLAVSLIAVAHRRNFQILLFLDQVLDGLYLCRVDHGGACALVSGLESEVADNRNLGARL